MNSFYYCTEFSGFVFYLLLFVFSVRETKHRDRENTNTHAQANKQTNKQFATCYYCKYQTVLHIVDYWYLFIWHNYYCPLCVCAAICLECFQTSAILHAFLILYFPTTGHWPSDRLPTIAHTIATTETDWNVYTVEIILDVNTTVSLSLPI